MNGGEPTRETPPLSPPFLEDEALLASETVVNAAMNRGRALTGVNSYERDLKMDIGAFLARRVQERGHAVWYDACCGEGRALREASVAWEGQRQWASRVQMLGVDLWDDFAPVGAPCVRFVAADVVTYDPGTDVDLITCVHGLHYLGDKLRFLERCYARLAPGGVFIGHLDTDNLRFEAQGQASPVSWSALLRRVRGDSASITYRNHLLRMERIGNGPLHFGGEYLGASVSERPNFSGMTGIDSWYRDAAVNS